MKWRVRHFILEILSLFSDRGEYIAAHADDLFSCRCPLRVGETRTVASANYLDSLLGALVSGHCFWDFLWSHFR